MILNKLMQKFNGIKAISKENIGNSDIMLELEELNTICVDNEASFSRIIELCNDALAEITYFKEQEKIGANKE